MARASIHRAVVTAALVVALASGAHAQLTDHVWVGGTGNQQWQVDMNWDLGMFPNDPGRMDMNEMQIDPVEGANLSVNLGANLNVDVGTTDVTIAALMIGSMSGAVTTNVTSSGGRLVFENFELNDDTDPDNVMCAFNCGAALITSQGVAGATNTISALVGVNDLLEVTGTKNITLAGGVEEVTSGSASLRALSSSATVFVTGNVITLNTPVMIGDNEEDLPLALNDGETSQGTLDISGVITGEGRIQLGGGDITHPAGTVILRGNNTYSGRTILARGNTLLAHDNALGTGDAKHSGPANQTGYNLMSDNDSRVISNEMIFAQWQTIKGEHSLEWSGIAYQDNARGWINILPAGKTLTLSGGQFPNHLEEEPPLPGRFLTLDGTGRTVITGGLHDEWSTETETMNSGMFVGSFRFRGTGTAVVSGGNSTYTGDTAVEGGNVHFATNADLGNTAKIVSSGGAVGVDTGVATNTAFLDKLNKQGSMLEFDASNNEVFDTGGLMLAPSDASANLNFTSGALNNAANMSVAAPETGLTYTGTITPADNTYRLGGGSGTLTLPNANQLTGARNVLAVNGGEVRLNNTNNYTGTTTAMARYRTSLMNAAEADTVGFDDDDLVPNDQIYVGTTITATTLANGGAASSIGSSTSDAVNLLLQGSTLKYVGGATSTDRLFTVGTGGATIDASGTGALNFTSTAPLAIDIAEPRTGDLSFAATGNSSDNRINVFGMPTTDDLQPGMPIMSPNVSPDSDGIPEDTVITRIQNRHQVEFSNPIAGAFFFALDTQITFGPAPERKLTLTGTSTANNTLAPVIGDASDGGVVGLTKTGLGKWIVTGNNTYTGDTTIEAGTLSITNDYLADAADVRLSSGALFDLNFMGTDVINALYFDGAPQATGLWGAPGNASADFQSALLSGTGLLQVMMAPLTGLVGDYNNNGVVDAADYTLWRNHLGGPGTALQNRDPDNMGAIGQSDYDVWKANFGLMAGSGAVAASAVGASAVPEPVSVVFVIVACAMTALARRIRYGD